MWYQKFEAKNLEEIVLPEETKKLINTLINKKDPFFLCFHSITPGVGKTNLAKIIGTASNKEVLLLKASADDSGKNEIINKFNEFSRKAYDGKLIIIEEGDNLTSFAQDALKNLLDYIKDTSVILTCNNYNSISDAVKSRLTYINFNFNEKYKKDLQIGYCKRLVTILNILNIEFDKNIIFSIVKDNYPSMRNILNEAENLYNINKNLLSYENKNRNTINDIENFIINENIFNIYNKLLSENYVNENIYKYLYNNLAKNITDNVKFEKVIFKINEYMNNFKNISDIELHIISLLLELKNILK